MPLSEKWVVTLSTQYGCPMKCTFCDVPNIPFNGNASFEDLKKQFYNAISLFPTVKYTERLNIHFARMGEPIFNKHVFDFSIWLYKNKETIYDDTGLRIEVIHPVLTTSLPLKFKRLEEKILEWCNIKNKTYNGQAGLQFSINSTCETQRGKMYNDMQISLEELSEITKKMPLPLSRKYCLNFAYSTDFIIDAKKIRKLFDPEKFMCKITPIHNNTACTDNNIKTIGGYDSWQPYENPVDIICGVEVDNCRRFDEDESTLKFSKIDLTAVEKGAVQTIFEEFGGTETSGVRLNICPDDANVMTDDANVMTDDANVMTDDDKWAVVRHIVNVLNGCVVENGVFNIIEQYTIVDDGHETISIPDNVITCTTTDNC